MSTDVRGYQTSSRVSNIQVYRYYPVCYVHIRIKKTDEYWEQVLVQRDPK